MVLRSCFPELPGGGCWPRKPIGRLPECFPRPERRPALLGRAPHNQRLQLTGGILKEVIHFAGAKRVARS